jgi:hypothetical protein
MKEIQEKIIEVCMKIAKRNEGALIIFGDLSQDFYKPLIDQTIRPFNIMQNLKLFESLALIDGAVLIDLRGNLYGYGISIRSSNVLYGFGTRHAAELSASLKDTTAFVVSEEEKKIKIFKKDKMIMQIDALEKGIEKKTSEISNLLESIGVGALGFASLTALGIVGVAFIQGVMVFGGSYYLVSKLIKTIRQSNLTHNIYKG